MKSPSIVDSDASLPKRTSTTTLCWSTFLVYVIIPTTATFLLVEIGSLSILLTTTLCLSTKSSTGLLVNTNESTKRTQT